MTSIRIEGLRKTFPGVVALDNIDLHIEEGEFFTLLGPSGCGKTTLLRTIAGFYKQDKGDIFLADALINNVPAHRRDTGMVFQNYAVFPHMTVFENVAFGLQNRKVPAPEIRERVAQALKMARLEGYEKRTPDQLSGGQQQRVGLARAMVIEPKVLLLDEPLSNLDAKLRVEMREEIKEIQHKLKLTAIYVTHDQEEALVISDRIAVMESGRIEQIASPWDIYKKPRTRFVSSFVGTMNFLDGQAAFAAARESGVLKGLLPADAPPETTQVAFRPEDVTVADEAAPIPAGMVAFDGKVEKAVFLGSTLLYRITCADDRLLTAEQHCPSRDRVHPEGTRVSLLVPASDVLLFDRESGSRVESRGGAA